MISLRSGISSAEEEAAGAVHNVTHPICLVPLTSLASESCLTLLTSQVRSFTVTHRLCYRDIHFQEMIIASLLSLFFVKSNFSPGVSSQLFDLLLSQSNFQGGQVD